MCPNVKLWTWLYVILVLLTMMIELSIVRKKQGTTKCDKSTVISNVGTAQCNNGTVKFEKKKGTTECDKNRIRCNVGTT